MRQFNLNEFKQQWRTLCAEKGIDPQEGAVAGNIYKVVNAKAERRKAAAQAVDFRPRSQTPEDGTLLRTVTLWRPTEEAAIANITGDAAPEVPGWYIQKRKDPTQPPDPEAPVLIGGWIDLIPILEASHRDAWREGSIHVRTEIEKARRKRPRGRLYRDEIEIVM